MPRTRARAEPAVDVELPRAPRQARGQRRVDAILDAAAALVTEVGPDGVTVQALAERARTSKGSLYHFFPDRDSVLRALVARHVEALRAMTDGVRPGDGQWRADDAADVVDRVVTPFLSYTDAHPDLLLVLQAPASPERDREGRTAMRATLIGLADSALRAWRPAMPADQRAVRAAAMVAVLGGVLNFTERVPEPPRAAMRLEMRRILAAYLGSFEAA